jgi:hypothetical protein
MQKEYLANHFNDERTPRLSSDGTHGLCRIAKLPQSLSAPSATPRRLDKHPHPTGHSTLVAKQARVKVFSVPLTATAIRKVYRPDVIREADVVIRLKTLVWLSCLLPSAAVSSLLFSKSHRRVRFFGRRRKVNERNGEYLPRLGNANSIKSLLFFGDSRKTCIMLFCVASMVTHILTTGPEIPSCEVGPCIRGTSCMLRYCLLSC